MGSPFGFARSERLAQPQRAGLTRQVAADKNVDSVSLNSGAAGARAA